VRRARLMALSPEATYRELQNYGEYLGRDSLADSDEELEKALLDRGNELIDLGLAQFGASDKVLSAIYERASACVDERNRALRLAVLGNPNPLKDRIFGNRYRVITDQEARRLAESGAGDEVNAWLLNPGGKRTLADLFKRQNAFEGVPEERLISMAGLTCTNPALTHDDSNEHGPDMDAWDIQKGLRDFLKTVSVTEHSLECLYRVLRALDPYRTSSVNEDPRPWIARC
jgi:hypothetical protein